MSLPSIKKYRIDHTLLFFGVALLPIYVFPSGTVQPAHLLLAAFFTLILIGGSVPRSTWLLVFIALVIYIFLIESFYVLHGGELSHLRNTIYLLYNLLLAAAIYMFCRRFGAETLVSSVFVAALIVSGHAFLSVYYDSGAIRFTGPFNNPNQLGFFSVVLISLACLFRQSRAAQYHFTAALVLAAVVFSIMSLSKAAMIPVLGAAFLVLKPLFNIRNANLIWVIWVLAVISSGFLLYQQGMLDEYRAIIRISGIFDEDDSSLEARGYLASMDAKPLQLIFGMGADHARSALGGKEVHSTLASVFSYYGFFGLFLFSTILALWARTIWLNFGWIGLLCILGPSMLYGLTHNGIRFSIFWILFGASLAMAHTARRYRTVEDYGSD